MLPCAYFLTEKKDCNLYKKIFTALKNAAEQKDYVLNPKTIVTDFELAVMNAYKFRNGYKLHYTINKKFNT